MTANRFNFRAYILKEKYMVDVEILHPEYILAYDGKTYSFNNINNSKNYILMQSTGLVDKNGKEIYEGDILTDGSIKYLVRFEEEKAWFIMKPILGKKILLKDYKELGKRYMNYYEIIGNIYENKELLKS